GPRRGTGKLLAVHRPNRSGEPCTRNNCPRKLKPGAIAGVVYVHNSLGILPAQLNDRPRQIYGIGWAAALIVHHIERGTAAGQLQDGIWKAFSAGSEKPRCSGDAAFGHQLQKFDFSLCLGSSVDALGIALIAGLVRRRLPSIENVVGTEEQQPRASRLRRRRDIDRSVAIHRKRQLLITLATVDIGVSRGQDYPLWTCVENRLLHTFRIANVGIARAQTGDRVSSPFAHQFLAKETG